MNMEFNKILAAVLTAGIIAYFSGLISHGLVSTGGHHGEKIEGGYVIAAAEAAADTSGAAAPTGPEPIDDYLAKADAAAGEKSAKVCAACHTFDKGGANRVGPNLHGVVGRARGSEAGFSYSDAMKAKGESWDAASLNEFLWSPKSFVPGTKMTFAGIKKPEDRAAVIKWLQTLK